MSRAATTRNEQAAVDKYLLPREVRVATVRRHPAVLIPVSARAVGGLLVAAVLQVTVLRSQPIVAAVVWAVWAVLLGHMLWKTVNWAVDYFVITSERILLTSGVFTRSVAMMPLTKVTDMSFHRSFAGRLLGYGEFVVESAGQDQALRTIDHIPYPEQLYLVICGRIFKDAAPNEQGTPVSPEPEDTFGTEMIESETETFTFDDSYPLDDTATFPADDSPMDDDPSRPDPF